MSHSGVARVRRLIGASTLALGLVSALSPATVIPAASRNSNPTLDVVRLLGARYAVQGTAELVWPRTSVMRCAGYIEGLHLLSMMALAVAQPAYRRPALVSATLATGSAAACLLTGRRMDRVRQ